MTNKEAIECIKSNYPDSCYSLLREACDLAIKVLENADKLWGDDFDAWTKHQVDMMLRLDNLEEKAEKYKWHNLNIDDTDLPLSGEMVLWKLENGSYFTDWIENNYLVLSGCYFSEPKRNSKIIAWKEIEPFEEELK